MSFCTLGPNVHNLRLKKSVEFWEQIGTSKFILDVIKEGYKITLLHKPEKTFLKNNKSSIEHKHFVDTAIVELLKAGFLVLSSFQT
jgi:hypothetical protein